MSGEDAIARMHDHVFFQTRAATGGMTQNGEMTRSGRSPDPTSAGRAEREQHATDDGDEKHAADQHQRVQNRREEAGLEKNSL